MVCVFFARVMSIRISYYCGGFATPYDASNMI